jgi:CARDB
VAAVNLGAFASPGSTGGVYLSTDQTITTSDTLLTTVIAPSLAPSNQSGYYDLQNVTITLPTNLAPGTYYIGGIADYNNQVAETNESNNTFNTVKITVGQSDLSAYVSASSTTMAVGASNTVSLYDFNLGSFASAAFLGRCPRDQLPWLYWEHGVLYLNEGAQHAAIDRLGEHGHKRRLIAVVHRQKPRRLQLTTHGDAVMLGSHIGMDVG